jgi:hypothetical protein
MKNKQQFLDRLSRLIDEIEDKDAEVNYFKMQFTNYNPNNKDNQRKLCYFDVEIDYSLEEDRFTVNDKSEPGI